MQVKLSLSYKDKLKEIMRQNQGLWDEDEHLAFLKSYEKYHSI